MTMASPDQSMNEQQPGWKVILLGWLMSYEVASAMGKGVRLFTTADIISELSDMCDLTPNDVADVLASLGYSFVTDGLGQHGWLLKVKDFHC
jgi:hypothetical protein